MDLAPIQQCISATSCSIEDIMYAKVVNDFVMYEVSLAIVFYVFSIGGWVFGAFILKSIDENLRTWVMPVLCAIVWLLTFLGTNHALRACSPNYHLFIESIQ